MLKFKSYYVVWKPFGIASTFSIFVSLNRTMQYGNDIFPGQERNAGLCLNRTMQYGNFFFRASTSSRLRRLNRTMQYGNTTWKLIIVSPTFLFKSYYVVWKPSNFARTHNVYFSFKSYYVVWKLYSIFHLRSAQTCLNRTMQYGNTIEAFTLLKKILFKSYYVVWKLSHFHILDLLFCGGLNRTMQYGNKDLCRPPLKFYLCLNRTMQYGNNII